MEELKQRLKEIEAIEEDFPGQKAEHRRQVIVRYTVDAAQNLIDEGSDGSVEETEYLTSRVASEFVKRVEGFFTRRLMMADLQAEGQRINHAGRADGVSGETQ
jgi:hypothetical protein